MTSSTPHWESRNGYTPPPRFQQLRARDLQQQQYQQQYQLQLQRQQQGQLQQQLQHQPVPVDNIPQPSPEMPHARSSSFFSFRANKQPTDGQTSPPLSQPAAPAQQYLPPTSPNPPAQSPSGLPPPVQHPGTYTTAPQQQQQPHYITRATPPVQQAPPPPNQLPQQVPQQQPQPPVQMSPPNQRPPLPQQTSPSQPTSPNPGTSAPSTAAPAAQPAPAQQMQHTRGASNAQGSAPPLHPEIRSVVQLTIAHAHKIYFSGPLVRRLERQPDGQKPHKDDGWTEIWAQLGGTTLSIWDMKEIQEASKQGREVPPSYINVTDAFVQVLGSVTVPATPTAPAKRYTNVLTLNTAGSNLLLFSCPSTQALIAWAASLRLASWEKSRLEEIYTAHLIRITLSARDVPTTLVQGKTEGWARVRIAGQTDWKRMFIVVQEGADPAGSGAGELGAGPGGGAGAGPNTIKKKRMSNLFSRDHAAAALPPKPMISMYIGQKPKDRKKAMLTIHSVSQAFGVYPERPELINKSTLIKVEGTFGDEELAASLRTREGWLLLMPELEEGTTGQAAEMLKWVVALHDAFELYGRPQAWTWDPRDPISLMFGYPVGPQKENLFLERELVEGMDPRNDRTSVVRTEMKKLLVQHMRPAVQAVPQRPANQPNSYNSPPSLPPVNLANNAPLPAPPAPSNQAAGASSPSPPTGQSSGFQLPPLSFNTNTLSPASPNQFNAPGRDRPLTPITEQSSIGTTHQRSMSRDASSTFASTNAQPPAVVERPPAPLASPSLPSPLSPVQPSSPKVGAPEPLAAAALYSAGPFSASPTPITPSSLAPTSSGPNATSFQVPPAGSGSGYDSVATNSRMLGASAGAVAGAMYTATSSPHGSSTNVTTTHANSSPSRSPSITSTTIMKNFPQVPSPPPSGGLGSGNVSPQPQSLSPPLHPHSPSMSTMGTTTMSTGPTVGIRASTMETRSPPPSHASADTRTPPSSTPTSPMAPFTAAPRSLSPQGQVPGQSQGQGQAKAAIVPSQEIAWQNAVQQQRQQATRTRTQDSFASRGGGDVASPVGGREQPQAGAFSQQQQQQQQLQQQETATDSPSPPPPPKDDGPSNDLSTEAGALYYMTNSSPATRQAPQQISQNQPSNHYQETTNWSDDAEEEEDQADDAMPEEEDEPEPQLPYNHASGSNSRAALNGPTSSMFDSTRMVATSSTSSSSMALEAGPPPSSYAPMRTTSPSSLGPPAPGPSVSGSPGRSVLGRKPSGARAQLTAPRSFSGHGAESISSQTVNESDEPTMATTASQPPHHRQHSSGSDVRFDDDGEALAALTYLDIADEQELVAASGSGLGAGSQAYGQDKVAAPAPPSRDRSFDDASAGAALRPGSGESGLQYKSSFAPSNKATERKAKAQAQQAAQHAATHKPGRANGKRKSRVGGAWESSEEEDEEEEEEEEEDDDDDDEADSQRQMQRGSQSVSSSQGGSHAPNATRPSLQQLRQPGPDYTQEMSPSHLRPPRNLPQIPGVRGNEDYPIQPIPRRPGPDQQFVERRTYYEDGTPIRTQAEHPQPGAARQSVWSQVLDPGRQPGRAPLPDSNNNAKDTFVQLEPSETMTKAFTPQGLLSAGLADKEDRSARRQEELARENGASLINVPNKPPPPQTGLLGAITAHERERKREGGVGAALTEREREKRVAEERQRRFDDQQRQQLEQMQQGGSMYGSQFGFNPMMNPMMMGMNPMMGMSPMMSGNGMMPGAGGLSPMMTGGNMGQMNPMMTGQMGQMGQMGFPGMMGGFNPQHMFAAQQAAAAYQQAMMAFSVAGSQVGGNDAAGGAGTPQGNPSGNPAMAGMQGMGGMPGYDPRMSMMGMPMMGMGMGMGMSMGGPMGQQITGQLTPGQMPLNMQMTGMSSFDARSSPGIANGGGGGSNDMGLQPPNQAQQLSSRTSSPASRGSPLARGHQETADRGRSSTRPTSPSR